MVLDIAATCVVVVPRWALWRGGGRPYELQVRNEPGVQVWLAVLHAVIVVSPSA